MIKILFLCLAVHLFGGYKVEGFSDFYDHEKRYFLISTFLPFNPTILSVSSHSNSFIQCNRYWPQGAFFSTENFDPNFVYDFLWIEDNALQWIESHSELIQRGRIL